MAGVRLFPTRKRSLRRLEEVSISLGLVRQIEGRKVYHYVYEVRTGCRRKVVIERARLGP